MPSDDVITVSDDVMCKKVVTDGHTHTQTDKIELSWSKRGAWFGTTKTEIPFANDAKQCPKTNLRIVLTTRIMSTSGLPRSLALSSICACGAIISIGFR